MAKTVEKNIKVQPSGAYFTYTKIDGKNLTLPDSVSLSDVRKQRDELLRKRATSKESAVAYANELKRARTCQTTTGERCVAASGSLYFARVTRGDTIYTGPHHREVKDAAKDRDDLEASSDVERAHAEMHKASEPLRALPQYVYIDRHGKFFAGVNDPHKGKDANGRILQVAGPTVATVEEAEAQARIFVRLRERGTPLKDAADAFHNEAAMARYSFVEAKGGGWQPKGFAGCPYYSDISQAVRSAVHLRSLAADYERRSFIRSEQQRMHLTREEWKRVCSGSAASGTLMETSTKKLIIWADVCVPRTEKQRNRDMTGKLLFLLKTYLSAAYEVVFVPLRDCDCDKEDGLCTNYTGADVIEARMRFRAVMDQRVQPEPFIVLSGRTFAAVAPVLMRLDCIPAFVHVPHPSRWITHLHATKAAMALNNLLGANVLTSRQLYELAMKAVSDAQIILFLSRNSITDRARLKCLQSPTQTGGSAGEEEPDESEDEVPGEDLPPPSEESDPFLCVECE
jgi:hypothetical protein